MAKRVKSKLELEKIEPKEVRIFDAFKADYLNDPKNSREPHAFRRAATQFANSHPEINKDLFLEIARDVSRNLL